MNCDVSAEKSNGYCYNIALKSVDERARIQLDLKAAGMVHKLKTGEITRRHIEIELHDAKELDREYLRERLNYYRTITNAPVCKQKLR